jgi:type I restriction enzyme S subunit
MEKQVAPQLRFHEFEGNWEEKLLDSIASFSKGKGISKANIDSNGKFECIRYGELYTFYNETIDTVKSRTNLDESELIFSEENDVIIPASGETQIDIATASCVLRSGIALGGDLNIIKTKSNGVFFSYYLNNKKKNDIAKLSQGISVVHLYSSQLKSLKINLPKLPEQQKIASFLTSVDERISLLTEQKEKLEQYKKGIMQQLFSQQLWLKDNDGKDFPNWEEKKLGEIGSTLNGLTGKTKEHFGEGKPYIQYMQIFKSSKINTDEFGFVQIKSNETQSKVQYGDVFFTTSSETPHEIGTSSVLLDEVDEVYLNSFCFGFRPNSLDELVPEFAQFLFRSNSVRNEIVKLAQGSTRFNMSKVQFMKQKISLPCKEEQQKIASFLSALDVQIEQLNALIENTTHFKKGLLQQMFV